MSHPFLVGDVVEWRPAVGGTSRGVVSKVAHGCVHVKSSQVNRRGRRVSRTVEVVFHPDELDKLWRACS